MSMRKMLLFAEHDVNALLKKKRSHQYLLRQGVIP